MSPKNLTGPIGIAQMSGDAAREGPSAFFMLMSHGQPATWRSSICCRFRFWMAA